MQQHVHFGEVGRGCSWAHLAACPWVCGQSSAGQGAALPRCPHPNAHGVRLHAARVETLS